jgi:hypothetical protein
MTSLRKIFFLLLAFFISLSIFGCAVSPLTAEKGPFTTISTEVIHYVPRDAPRNERTGSCWTNSIAAQRDGAWRCMAGNEIFDPCFTLGPAVVCGVNPATDKQGFRLVLDKPLPSTRPAASGEAGSGWLIQLADGTICNRATGARGMVDGQMTTYYCTSKSHADSAAVLGELKTGTVWMADIAVMDRAALKIKERKTVPVVRVWQ